MLLLAPPLGCEQLSALTRKSASLTPGYSHLAHAPQGDQRTQQRQGAPCRGPTTHGPLGSRFAPPMPPRPCRLSRPLNELTAAFRPLRAWQQNAGHCRPPEVRGRACGQATGASCGSWLWCVFAIWNCVSGVRYGALAVGPCGAGPKGAHWWGSVGNQPPLSGRGNASLVGSDSARFLRAWRLG
jgi:hypothetical protein